MVIVDLVSKGMTKGDTTVKVVARAPAERHRERALARNSSVRVVIKTGRKILFIDLLEIVAFEARGGHVVAHLKRGSRRVRQSISKLSEELVPFGFVRIHCAFIVNSALVREIEALPRGDYLLRIEGGKEYTVTQRHKENLRVLAASWLGSTFSTHMNSLAGIGIR